MLSRRVILGPSLLALLAAACQARPVRSPSTASVALAACTPCHGDPAQQNAAPPRSVSGATDTTDPAVGAHQSHLVAGHFRGPIACQDCHLVPAAVDAPGHFGGVPAAVRFDAPGSTGVAGARGAKPGVVFGPTDAADPQRRPDATCSVYCHGATLDGGTRTAPTWAGRYQAGSSTLDCTSCHGLPPGGKHPQDFARTPDAPARACARCHSLTVAPDGTIDLAGGKHVNGVVDFSGGDACSACHGDGTRIGVAGADPLVQAAPPVTVTGAAPGAHLAHVNGQGTALRPPLACTECHARVAEETAAVHPDGKVDVDFGALASTSGLVPSWDPGAGSCAATYCHGATLTGGTHTAPRWTGGSAEAACGTCHGVPPPAPHVQNVSCGSCHVGYTATTVNAAIHANGHVDVGALTCSSCHGDGTRVAVSGADADVQAAPPVDARGSSAVTSRGVGAHLGHVNQVSLRAAPLGCAECHFNAVPTTTDHATGTVAFAFGPLARNASWGGVTPAPAWDGTSCSGTYCHGAFKNGANATVAWAQGLTVGCTSCHGVPPGGGHPKNTACGNCHPGYTSSSVDSAKHINGALDVIALTCTSCHGDATRVLPPGADPVLLAAPPLDTSGQSSSTAVGAHQVHLSGSAVSAAVACTECHPVPATTTHATGTVAFAWGALAASGGATPSFNPASATCAGVYCHGNYQGTFTYNVLDGAGNPVPTTYTYSGGAGSPVWSGAAMTCGSCHAMPPNKEVWHSGSHGGGNQCELCHPDATGTISSGPIVTGAAITNPAQHVNGVVEVTPTFTSTCFDCH